jgi:predicted MPP superfamily phosphohydrolase
MLSRLPIALLLLGGLHYYIGTRLIGRAGLHGAGWWAAWLALWLLLASVPLGFLASRLFPGRIARGLRAIANFWVGSFGLLLTAVVITDLARMFLPLSGSTQAALVLVLVCPAIAFGYRTASGPAKLERLRFPISTLGAAFEGFRIVQLSDLHVTESTKEAALDRLVERVNALKPDVVAITGDLIDGDVAELRSRVARFANLRAPEGVFFVTGNHEYYHGAPAWEAELRRLGIVVLHNQHRLITRGTDALVLAGITDFHGGYFHPSHQSRPDLAFAGAPLGVPRVLLAHQPRSAADAATHHVDLQLSGHTHGGQIFPFMFFVRLQQPVVSGLRKLFGIWVYTNRGTGYWGPPMRVGPSPEITEVELVRAA